MTTAFSRQHQCRIYFKILSIKSKEQNKEACTRKFRGNLFICFTILLILLSRKQIDYRHLHNLSLPFFQFGSVHHAWPPECLGKFSVMESYTTPFSPFSELQSSAWSADVKDLSTLQHSSSKGMFTQFF